MIGSEILETIDGCNIDETSLWSDIHVKTIAPDLIYSEKTQNKIATAFLPRFFHHNLPTLSNSSSDAALKISRALGTAGNCCSQHKAHLHCR